jgi:hypothetical protein
MAGCQPIVHAGLRFTVKPAYWARRLSHFPFFFESHNPSFTIKVHRIAEAPAKEGWPNGKVPFEIRFADGTITDVEWPIPELQVGQYQRVELRHIFTAYPGRTIIRVPVHPGEWKTIYAYDVWREEALWLGVWGAFIAVAALIIAVAGIVGVAR